MRRTHISTSGAPHHRESAWTVQHGRRRHSALGRFGTQNALNGNCCRREGGNCT
jgi:hypothetical protein